MCRQLLLTGTLLLLSLQGAFAQRGIPPNEVTTTTHTTKYAEHLISCPRWLSC